MHVFVSNTQHKLNEYSIFIENILACSCLKGVDYKIKMVNSMTTKEKFIFNALKF